MNRLSAGIFYGSFGGGPTAPGAATAGCSSYGGSIAYLFSFGLSLQAAYAENESAQTNATKGKNWYAKIGYKFGNNAFSIGYGESKDASQTVINTTAAAFALAGIAGDGSGWNNKGFNIGFNHNIPKAKVDLYAGLAWNQLDTPSGLLDLVGGPGTSVDDIYTVTVGTKLKFD